MTDSTSPPRRLQAPERAEIDTDRASVGHVYDYLLGGTENYAVDREAGDALIAAMPDTPLLAKANRAFVRQAVRFLVGRAGIRQIIDIGSGLPTAGNVHDVAHEIDPAVRVVYVDNDPTVLVHGGPLLSAHVGTTLIEGDVRDPDAIFDHPETRRLIDFSEPFAVLLGGILMHLDDEDDPEGVAARIRDRLPSGRYLLVSNTCDTGEPRVRELIRAAAEWGLGSRCFRTWDEQIRSFDGLELIAPGLVPNNVWRPGLEMPDPDDMAHALHIGGIARKG